MVRKIINAMIVDGTGAEPFLGGIEIREGRITRVFRGTSRDPGEDVIDARGLFLTPGFVDIHRHHDIAAMYDPSFGDLELAQGITTAVAGNCGLAPFPNADRTRQAQFDYIEPCLGRMDPQVEEHLLSEYMDRLDERKLPLNVAFLTGAGACATAAMGYENRPFTAEERAQAVDYIKDAMEHGALGMSFGIMYLPECYLAREDMVAMARECGAWGGMVSCHIRGEGDSLVESVKEIISICKEAGVPLNISHFKATGVRNWNKGILEAIEIIEQARAEGQIVTCDAYPYTGGATTALSLIPPSVIEGKELAFLGTPEGIKKLEEEIYRKQPGWDNMVESIGWERVVIGSVTLEKNRIYAGRSVADIARDLGFDDPCQWFGPLVAEEEGKVGITIFSMDQQDVDRVLSLPYAALISDSLYGGGDNPHPRLYGAFPRFIREYVRERKVLSLAEAIRKMTSMPAERVGLQDRGVVDVGYAADLNLFDPEKITDRATFTDSRQLSEGIALTLVGGEIAAKNSRRVPDASGAGRVLRRKTGV